MGTKRGGASGSFVSEATRLLLDFYRGVVEAIKPWRPQVPKLPVRPDIEDIATQPENVVEQVTRQQMAGTSERIPSDLEAAFDQQEEHT